MLVEFPCDMVCQECPRLLVPKKFTTSISPFLEAVETFGRIQPVNFSCLVTSPGYYFSPTINEFGLGTAEETNLTNLDLIIVKEGLFGIHAQLRGQAGVDKYPIRLRSLVAYPDSDCDLEIQLSLMS